MPLRYVPPQHRATVVQVARFGISGGLLTLLHNAIYAAIAVWLKLAPQLGNIVGYLIAVGVGYLLHSRWSFAGHGQERDRATVMRFAMTSVIGYLLNSFWVWLLTAHLGLHPAWPVVPMLFVSPVVTFALNRFWVFR